MESGKLNYQKKWKTLFSCRLDKCTEIRSDVNMKYGNAIPRSLLLGERGKSQVTTSLQRIVKTSTTPIPIFPYLSPHVFPTP